MITINIRLIRNIFIILLLFSLGLGFSKSYTSYTIDNLDFVLAVGIDVADSDDSKLKLSFEFAKISSFSGDSSSPSENEAVINSVEADSIDSAINLMNAHMGKELKLSHCKLLVFSEKLAEKGISDEVYTLVNNIQIRPSTNIVVSKCSPEYYLKNMNPSVENYVTKYYEAFPNSGKYTGYTTNATIGDFFYSMATNTCESYAILGGVNFQKDSSYKNLSDIKTGSTPVQSDRKGENVGLAVFKGDRLVGELSALDTLCFSIITNKLNNFMISIPNPNDSNNSLDIYLYDDTSTDIKVDIINDSPYITVDVKLSGIIGSINYNSKYLNESTLSEISNYTSSYLESVISDYLYKTAKVYKADIHCMGKKALKNFATWNEYESYNWKDRYRDSFFNVNVDTTVKSGYVITET